MTNAQKRVLKRNPHTTMVGSVLARPGYIKPPKSKISKLDELQKAISEAEAAQAKVDEKFAKIRFPFLLTNPERESVREKAPGLVRLHQCAFSAAIGKLLKCQCEYVSQEAAAMLKKYGQAGEIKDERGVRPDGARVPGTTGMQLYVSAEEWETLCQMREFDRYEKQRLRLDAKHAKQRQRTFERKRASLAKEFNRLLQTQGLGSVDEETALSHLRTGTALQLFEKEIPRYAARQLVIEYWDLVLDVENLHEEAGIEIVLQEPMKDLKFAKQDAPKTDDEIKAAISKDPDVIIEPDMDVSGLSHSSGRTEVMFRKNRSSRGEKMVGGRFKWTSGGYSTTGETDDHNTNIDHLSEHRSDDGDGRVTPDGAGPDD